MHGKGYHLILTVFSRFDISMIQKWAPGAEFHGTQIAIEYTDILGTVKQMYTIRRPTSALIRTIR